MNESSAIGRGSWARTLHTPGPAGRGDPQDHGELAGPVCEQHPQHGQPDADEIGMCWALARHGDIRTRTSRLGDGHVAA